MLLFTRFPVTYRPADTYYCHHAHDYYNNCRLILVWKVVVVCVCVCVCVVCQ